jgi:hypothetical protein
MRCCSFFAQIVRSKPYDECYAVLLSISLSEATEWTSVEFNIQTLSYTLLGEFNFCSHEPDLYQTARRHILGNSIIHSHPH